jgi:urease subunit alpha
MFGAFGRALEQCSVSFVSEAAKSGEIGRQLGLRKPISAVRNCRNITKKDMRLNDYLPDISVDPETYKVRADGDLLTCEPADSLPLAQRYFLF